MSVRIIQGDVRDEVPKLRADYFDCIVTSPPYYGLRDYGTANWEGGDPNCKHLDQSYGKGRGSGVWFDGGKPRELEGGRPLKGQCPCGAKRIDAQIGLEPMLDTYLETMVAVCRELRRVLKPSGVCFINIGDSYCSSPGKTSSDPFKTSGLGGRNTSQVARQSCQSRPTRSLYGLKPKDLMLVPERLGIALQADGWWVRSRIVWAKPNPMPESITDRPTSAHETIWMLTKSERYFWDGEAVREEAKDWSLGGPGVGMLKTFHYGNGNGGNGGLANLAKKYKSDTQPHFRNLRNVWTIPSNPFPGAHFATFPPALVERCIKAGSNERGCCAACGAPWERVMEKTKTIGWYPSCTCDSLPRLPEYPKRPREENAIPAWEMACEIILIERRNLCGISAPIKTSPAQTLDPFAGSGTVGLVVDRLGRDATLIDLNTSYIDMAVNRIRDDSPLFAEVAAE